MAATVAYTQRLNLPLWGAMASIGCPYPQVPFPESPAPSSACLFLPHQRLSEDHIAHGVVKSKEECCGG
eukprot:COSAG05_NODE_2180_length_3432_cov_2.161416_3_plen_69_part_00